MWQIRDVRVSVENGVYSDTREAVGILFLPEYFICFD
jgi:hypothetical protein